MHPLRACDASHNRTVNTHRISPPYEVHLIQLKPATDEPFAKYRPNQRHMGQGYYGIHKRLFAYRIVILSVEGLANNALVAPRSIGADGM